MLKNWYITSYLENIFSESFANANRNEVFFYLVIENAV